MIEWVVEASTFCNLRCAYCYQWDGLSDRHRLPLEVWRRVLQAVCDYHVHQESRSGRPVYTRVIWHGGEPLTLPLSYLADTFALKEELARAAGIPDERITTTMQTNLYAVSDAMLDLLAAHHVGFGVSFDLVRGVRVAVNGQPSEDRVLANLDRLREAGVAHGAITVLARHTAPMICDVFDFWAARCMSFRVLPLFSGPAGRATEVFEADETELVEAMCRLFDHWMRSRSQITVAPLAEWLTTVVRQLLGLQTTRYDRRAHGESVLTVRPDGTLFQVAEAGVTGMALGDLRHQTMTEILNSSAYAASLERTEEMTAERCTGCRFLGACDCWPAHTAPVEPEAGSRCHVAYRVQAYMESYLRRAGLSSSALLELLDSTRAASDAGQLEAMAGRIGG